MALCTAFFTRNKNRHERRSLLTNVHTFMPFLGQSSINHISNIILNHTAGGPLMFE